MYKKTVVSFVILGFSTVTLGVTEKPSSITLTSTMEVLKLPTENRKIIIQAQGNQHYQNFISVAFNDSQPLALRWRALTAAAEVRGSEATADLLKAGAHKEWYMRNAALVALAEVNPIQGEQLAKKLLKDKALVVRSAAVETLQKNLSPENRDLLWEELNQNYNFKNTESLWIRKQIVGVLSQKPLDRETKLFAQLLFDKDASVHAPAIRGLEKLTGVKLGEEKEKPASLVGLWKNYLKKEKLEF
ncbi:MAG: HEAT repeat domain-containing protein [Bdellovibrio sp.]